MANELGKGIRLPRIRHNDYTSLNPSVGDWEPRISVSVVIPAPRDQSTLDLIMAALAAQSYSPHLLEVIIVSDGSSPPLRIPGIAPQRSRVISTPSDQLGPASSVHAGVSEADGEVILRLGSDVLLCREHVDAHMRWHHVAGYLAVVGNVASTRLADRVPSAEQVYESVQEGDESQLFDASETLENPPDSMAVATSGPAGMGALEYRLAYGAAASWTAQTYRAAGEMDLNLPLGADLELSYRITQAGAVVVPEPRAHAWHLTGSPGPAGGDPSSVPFLSHRVPLLREWRNEAGRQWKVPYVDVVVDARGSTYEEVNATVSGALGNTLPDVGVTILGSWSTLPSEVQGWLGEPVQEPRLIHAAFAHDGRVTLRESIPETSAPSPFRFVCPAGLVPTVDALRQLVEFVDERRLGLLLLAFSRSGIGLQVARLERTQAMARAAALVEQHEHVVDVVDEIFGVHWMDGSEWALVTGPKVPRAMSVPELHAELARLTQLADRRARMLAERDTEIERWKRELALSRRPRRARLWRALAALKPPLATGSSSNPAAGSRA
jgi:hypothetical protein